MLEHPWFKDIKTEDVMNHVYPSPFKPTTNKDPYDLTNFDQELVNLPLSGGELDENDLGVLVGKEKAFEGLEEREESYLRMGSLDT